MRQLHWRRVPTPDRASHLGQVAVRYQPCLRDSRGRVSKPMPPIEASFADEAVGASFHNHQSDGCTGSCQPPTGRSCRGSRARSQQAERLVRQRPRRFPLRNVSARQRTRLRSCSGAAFGASSARRSRDGGRKPASPCWSARSRSCSGDPPLGVHAQGDPTADRRLAGSVAAQEGAGAPAERPALPAGQCAGPTRRQ